MINWFDMPAEGLSNGGLFEVKELEVTENGTYETKGEMYNKVTVNVEGGGGSSDFSTAKLRIINNGYGGEPSFFAPNYYVDDGDSYITYKATIPDLETSMLEYNIVIFKDGYTNIGLDNQYSGGATFSISGDIVDDDEGYFIITGDCTITIS